MINIEFILVLDRTGLSGEKLVTQLAQLAMPAVRRLNFN